jgi:hypothetical protein
MDPVGWRGPAEFDAGRWVARCLAVTPPTELPDLTRTALLADPMLRPDALDECVGLELVMEVRHRLESPGVFLSVGADPVRFNENTAFLVAAARSRLS